MFDILNEKFASALKNIQGKGKISESNISDALGEIRTALLEADVNFKVVRNFVNAVKEKALGEKVISGVNPSEQFIKIVHDELAEVMGKANEEIELERDGIVPVLIVGLNGQGKTTFCGKLSRHLTLKKKKNVLLVPADNFRPAAKKQLEILAKDVGVDCFDSDLSMLPKDIVIAGMAEAKRLKKDVVIIDTAGRLHVDEELMGQLKDVREVLKDQNPDVLLVADAMTGQEAVNVAKTFHETVGLSGVVLSKMDSDARGGAALSIRYVTGVPIHYISNGEKMKDLELFHPDRLAKRILDMGDILSLVEKAEEVIDEKDAEKMMQKMEKGKFTIDDFMKQMNMMKKMGSMSSLLKMIPGMGGALREVGDLSPAEDEMDRMKVIISSMTKGERDNYKIIKESRISRIAKGSGNTIQAVKDFLAKFKQMESMMGNMMGMLKGGGGMPGFAGPQAGFRQQKKQKNKKGKKKGPWGGGFFNK
ncbi:MAG: signal recognition particle protein [Epsilonproteobacteria bacterium]|nr:MAG: signal recognition particle protein [Campylobacterota bacterium]